MQGVGVEHLACPGVHRAGHQHLVLLLAGSHSHHHGLCSGGRAVVHRGVADVHACQLGHHRLVLEDVVQRALRDFCLIGRVGREELRALQQAWNHGGRVVVIDAVAREASQLLVLRAKLREDIAHLQFAHLRWQLVVAPEANAFRYLGVQGIERIDAHSPQHRLEVLFCMREELIHFRDNDITV